LDRANPRIGCGWDDTGYVLRCRALEEKELLTPQKPGNWYDDHNPYCIMQAIKDFLLPYTCPTPLILPGGGLPQNVKLVSWNE